MSPPLCGDKDKEATPSSWSTWGTGEKRNEGFTGGPGIPCSPEAPMSPLGPWGWREKGMLEGEEGTKHLGDTTALSQHPAGDGDRWHSHHGKATLVSHSHLPCFPLSSLLPFPSQNSCPCSSPIGTATPGSCWDCDGIGWDPAEILLGSGWDPAQILQGSCWDPAEIIRGSGWDPDEDPTEALL